MQYSIVSLVLGLGFLSPVVTLDDPYWTSRENKRTVRSGLRLRGVRSKSENAGLMYMSMASLVISYNVDNVCMCVVQYNSTIRP